MAHRLIALPWPRRMAAAALVLAVVVVHGCMAENIAERMADFGAAAAMPPRIEVSYVREMEPAAPAAVHAAAPRPTLRPHRARVAAPEPAASAAPPAVEPAPPPESPPLALAEPPAPPAEPPAAPPDSVAPASAPASAAAPFAWPVSTRLSYVLVGNYRGEIRGNAQVEWVRVGARYQVHLDVSMGLGLLSRRMSSEGQLTPEGLWPERYDEETRVGFSAPRRAALKFEPDAVVMHNGLRRERWPGVQDTASQFGQLAYLFTTQPELLTPGRAIDIPLALPRNVDHWVYDVIGSETLYTPFGQIEAMHLKPRRPSRPGGDLTIEMWIAPTLAYLPARIRIQQDADTFIDLMIARKPQLASQ